MISINNRRIDDPQNIYVIAEISGNHNQDYAQAERLVAAAAEAGCSAVKVQTFVAEDICADLPFPYGYNKTHDAWARRLGVVGLRDLFKLGGFPRAWHAPLKRFAESCGVEFLSTPFSVDAARFLVEEVGVGALKIASGDLTFTPLLQYAAQTNLPIILSTGGATLTEVRDALNILWDAGIADWSRVVLLHCVSVYPCHETYTNLQAIKTLQGLTGRWPVGFSDHTLSWDIVPTIAAALGCCVYEKHITLDRNTVGVDAAHSLEPGEFRKMVDVLRKVPIILGSGIKEPHAMEQHDRLWARRSREDWLRPTQRAREGEWE